MFFFQLWGLRTDIKQIQAGYLNIPLYLDPLEQKLNRIWKEMSYLPYWKYWNEIFTLGMYTVATLLCCLLLVMKSKFRAFACKYSHTTASIYTHSQEIEIYCLGIWKTCTKKQHQAWSTHVRLVTLSTSKPFLIKLFIEVIKQ